MDYQDYLENFQHQIKEIVIKKLDRAFEVTNAYLQPTSDLSNELLLLKGRFNQVKKEYQQGLITNDLYQTQNNRISLALLNLIDRINYPDIKPQDDEVFNSNLLAYQKAQQISTVTPPEVAPSAIIANSPVDDSIKTTAPSPDLELPKLDNILDFNLYLEQHKNWLGFYPIIYRKMQAFSIKNVNDKAAMQHMVQQIEMHKSTLMAIQSQVRKIEKNRNPIRLHEKGNFFWLQILRIQDLSRNANFDKMDDLLNEAPAINQLFEELSSLDLI